MNPGNYKKHLDIYLQSLQEDIRFLEGRQLPVFKTLQIDCSLISEDFDYWAEKLIVEGITNTCSVLYYFSFEKIIDSYSILQKVAKRKEIRKNDEHNKYIALPKINKGNAGICSGILYVGKTNKDFASRLKHHLGLVDSHTYALQLKHWAAEFKFTLHFAVLGFEKKDLRYLEQMETVLHYGLKPLLGRSRH